MRLSMDCVNFFRIGPKKRAARYQIYNSSIEDVIVLSLQ